MILENLILLVWVLGFVHLWNEPQEVFTRPPVIVILLDGRKVPVY